MEKIITWLYLVLEQLSDHWVEVMTNFGATFFGILASFGVEHCRSRNQEKDDFGKVLQSLAYENEANLGLLPGLKDCSVSTVPAFSLSNQLPLVLGNPLFHRWAKHSLVLAALTLSDTFYTY